MAEKMNPEIKADWLKSLRSGQYQQGAGCLRATRDGERQHCCLGVLTDRAVLAGVVESWEGGTVDGLGYAPALQDSVDGEWQILPETVKVWAGLGNNNPDVLVSNPGDGFWSERLESLAELNDGGLTFAEIADLIEEQL